MHKKMTNIRSVMMYIATLVLAVGYPMSTIASAQEVTENPIVQVEPSAGGNEVPPENPPETAPSTQTLPVVEQPKEPKLTYVYNPATGRWDSEKWQYNPATSTYEKPIIIAPEVTNDTETDKQKDESSKTVDTHVTVDNTIKSDAISGDGSVISNTLAGDAASGDATATANLVNIVNSNVKNGNNAKIAEFTQDIYGDVKGDILLSPMLLKAFLEAEANKATNTLIVNNNLQVNNNLDLNALSGNSTVSGNTKAGNATTGSAAAMANVVNILNSMIATQQSFMGTINIYGNLEGDILLAPDFIPQMIESNSSLKNDDGSDVVISTNDTQSIVNNISAAVESGAAAVFSNTQGGNATTGTADSNVVIFNLTGHEIVAKNSLLVFINVLGRWVGAIVDAPQGATAALIGNGVSGQGRIAPDLTVNAESVAGITNNISVVATSGDATVSNNTEAGNATSGNAKAAVNVANIVGNQFALSDWFGVMTVNIFGEWLGDFGRNTHYGDNPVMTGKPVPVGPIQFIPQTESKSGYQLYATNTGNARMYVVLESASNEDGKTVSEASAVLAKQAVANVSNVPRTANDLINESFDFRLIIVAGSILVIGASALGLKRLLG